MNIDFSGTYFIKELYDIGAVVNISKPGPNYLNWDNCEVTNKTLHEDCVMLRLEGKNNDLVGESIVKVKPQFITKKDLLTKFFINQEIMYHTLNELINFKVTI